MPPPPPPPPQVASYSPPPQQYPPPPPDAGPAPSSPGSSTYGTQAGYSSYRPNSSVVSDSINQISCLSEYYSLCSQQEVLAVMKI